LGPDDHGVFVRQGGDAGHRMSEDAAIGRYRNERTSHDMEVAIEGACGYERRGKIASETRDQEAIVTCAGHRWITAQRTTRGAAEHPRFGCDSVQVRVGQRSVRPSDGGFSRLLVDAEFIGDSAVGNVHVVRDDEMITHGSVIRAEPLAEEYVWSFVVPD